MDFKNIKNFSGVLPAEKNPGDLNEERLKDLNNFFIKNLWIKGMEDNNSSKEIDDNYNEFEQRFLELSREEKDDIIDKIEQTQFSLNKNFDNLKGINVFYKLNTLCFENQNKTEFLKYFEIAKRNIKQEDMSFSFYQYSSLALLDRINDCEEDFINTYKENDVNGVSIILKNIFETKKFYQGDANDFSKQAENILNQGLKETDNYFITKLTNSIFPDLNNENDDFYMKIKEKKNFGRHNENNEVQNKIYQEIFSLPNGRSMLSGLDDVSFLFNRELIKNIEDDFDIEVNLNDRESLYLMQFLKQVKNSDIARYKEFFSSSDLSNEEKQDRKHSLLSFQIKGNEAGKILDLTKYLDEQESSLVFKKISEIIDIVDDKEVIESNLKLSEKEKISIVLELRIELLKEAHQIIDTFIADKGKNSQDLLRQLENKKQENLLLISALKSLNKVGTGWSIENVKSLNFSIKDYNDGDITEEEKVAILKMSEKNYKECDNNKFQQEVVAGLKEDLKDPKDKKYYILKNDKDLIGFVKFEKKAEGHAFASSFNVRDDLRGLKLGDKIMKKALIKEGESNILDATVLLHLPVASNYIEEVGFKATGYIDNYHQTGEKMLTISLDNERNEESNNKRKLDGKEDDERKLEIISQAIYANKIDEFIGEKEIFVRINKKNKVEFEALMAKLLVNKDDKFQNKENDENKYELMRMFKDDINSLDDTYMVFEKIS